MRHYKKVYSAGTVKPYTRSNGKAKWRFTIKEGTVSEAVDSKGRAIVEENGSPRLQTQWRTLTKVYDGECVQERRNGKTVYRGQKKADAAFKEWRDQLLERADADYEAVLREDDEKARAVTYRMTSMLVPDFLSMYLDEREDDGIEASTLDGYRFSARYARDYFRNTPIGEVTEDDLKAFNRDMNRRGLSPTTRSKAIKVLKFAFDEHQKQIGTDPFYRSKKWMPTPSAQKPNPLDEKSIDTLKGYLADAPANQFNTAIEIAYRTGMRAGEVCGLRWRDVDEKTGTVHVCNAIGRINGKKGKQKGGTYEKAPKDTGRNGDRDPTRFIMGSEKLKGLFDRRRAQMAREIAEARGIQTSADDELASLVKPDMFVVGNPDGSYLNPTVLSRLWRGYSQGLMGIQGHRPTYHDLRHTYATMALHAGIDPMVVAANLGHRDPSITMTTYGFAMPWAKQRAATVLDEVL